MDNLVIYLISIKKYKIKNLYISSEKQKIPCLRFKFQYGRKNLFIFSCIFFDDKPMKYSVSFDSNPLLLSLTDWHSRLTYAMKHFIKNNSLIKEEVILYSRSMSDMTFFIKYYAYRELVEPGFIIKIKTEPKKIRRILLSIYK
jgi:hypothetical protein